MKQWFYVMVVVGLLGLATQAHAKCSLPKDGLSVFYDNGLKAEFTLRKSGEIFQVNTQKLKKGVEQISSYSWKGMPVFMDAYVGEDYLNGEKVRQVSHTFTNLTSPDPELEKALADCEIQPGIKLNYVQKYDRHIENLADGTSKDLQFTEYVTLYRLSDKVVSVDGKIFDCVVIIKDIARRERVSGNVESIYVKYFISKELGVYIKRDLRIDDDRFYTRKMVQIDIGT